MVAKIRWRRWRQIFVTIAVAASLLILSATESPAIESTYQQTQQAPFNQISHYPITNQPPSNNYRPIAKWVGRLILPETNTQDRDWVWLEVHSAPASSQTLVGQQVRLEWSNNPAIQRYVQTVTKDVNFTPSVATSQAQGNLHADRLNGRQRVGPLQSLAGAHPIDDVIVSFDQATAITSGNLTRLQIATEPVSSTGRFYGLVNILGPASTSALIPPDCPGAQPCPSELFKVQHYDAQTQAFTGAIETIRIPQQPHNRHGVFNSTPRELETSPAGKAGWYIYGANDRDGRFTVQAIKPRALFQLQPQQTITSQIKGIDYINSTHWDNLQQRRGQVRIVQLQPPGQSSNWQPGQPAVVMHLFGGRGGENGEKPLMGTITGHFSYGLAQVVTEPIAEELQWDIQYQQVYATNTEGVISGTQSWAAYMGDLRRGWLGTRPVSDVLVMLDIIEDYNFGDITVSPLQEFQNQLQIINARYRTGDGSGAAIVTPATSCVQDSNQALFSTILQVRKTVANNVAIQQWLKDHPQDPTTKRFQKLIQLGDEFEQQLMPLGIVREDWKTNSEVLSGTTVGQPKFRRVSYEGINNTLAALTSWRSFLPRQTQDELSLLFWKKGAQLWMLHTNQVGGHNPDITPIAPTGAFGYWAIPGTSITLLSVIFTRVLGAISLPRFSDWLIALAGLGGFSVIAIPLGLRQQFLQREQWPLPRAKQAWLMAQLFFMPALVEELIFRVLLLPAPLTTTWLWWSVWAIASLGLFVLYHPLNAATFYPIGKPTFFDRRFLVLAALLGLTCTIVYAYTSSLLLITLLHWIIVCVWLSRFGGMQRLSQGHTQRQTAP